MNLERLVMRLRHHGVSVRKADGRLRISGPVGELPPDLIEDVRAHKNALLELVPAALTSVFDSEPESNESFHAPSRATRLASQAQERLWFLQRLYGGNAYNLACVIRLDASIDAAPLEYAFRMLLDRHEPLRTVFDDVEGACVPRPLPSDTFVLGATSIADAELAESIRLLTDRPFELAADLPVRATLFRHGRDRSTLAIAFHHIAIDGWSLAIVLDELAALVAGIPLPPLAADYQSWAHAERAALESAALEERLTWWKRYLQDVSPRGVPERSDAEGAYAAPAAAHVSVAISPALRQQVADVAASLHTTPFSVFATTFGALLSTCRSGSDAVIATPVANRARRDAERIVGLLSNTIALRCRVADDLSHAALIRRMASDVFEALCREDVPFNEVVAALGERPDGAGRTLFEAMLVMQPELTFRLGNRACEVELCRPPSAKCDLTLTVLFATGVVNLEYRRGRFSEAAATSFLDSFVALLEHALSDIHAPLASSPVLQRARAAWAGSDASAAPALKSPLEEMPGTAVAPAPAIVDTPERPGIEAVVSAIWRDLLKIQQVTSADDFFALGGHSLLAMRLASRVSRQLHLVCAVSTVFAAPRLGDFVSRLRTAAPLTHNHTPRESRAARATDYPSSFAQERLWIVDYIERPASAYNLSAAVVLSGHLDVMALTAAVDDVVDRHEVLRVVLRMTSDGVRQLVRQEPRPRLAVVRGELAAIPSQLDEVMYTPFDLDGDEPLIRFRLFASGPDEHLLAVSLHHSVGDGWSMAILRRELAEAYSARRTGRAPVWTELPLQYADFATAQRRTGNSPTSAEGLAYWKHQLADLPDVCTLPVDFKRPEQRTNDGSRVAFQLPSAIAEGTRRVAAASGASPFMVLFSAFAIVVSRLSGDPDVVVGTPFAGRSNPDLESLIGCFVNTLVLRVRVDLDQSFQDLLSTVRANVMACHAHQDVSFDAIVQSLKPVRAATTPPLFQMLFSMDVPDVEPFALEDLQVTPFATARWAAKYDVNLHFAEDGAGGIGGYLEHASELYEHRTVERFIESLFFALEQVAARPSQSLSEVSILSVAQQHELASVVRPRPGADPPCAALIHQEFAAQAARTPRAVALELGSASVRYRELLCRSNQLAHHLHGLGADVDVPVGVLMRRSTERATALLGILSAGACYLPLGCDWPAERQRLVLEQAGATIVITDAPGEASDLGRSRHVIDGRAIWTELTHLPTAAPASGVTPDNLAYVLFTSGSTGGPKGVMVRHRGVAHDLRFLAELLGLAPGHRVLQVTEYTFDPSVRDLFAPLTSGATAVLLNADEASDPRATLDRIAATRITHVLSMTPTLLRAGCAATVAVPQTLDVLMLNGEPLTAADLQLVRARFDTRVKVFNQYGPTETTMTSCVHEVGPDDMRRARIPVGPPNPRTEILVLDEAGRPQPIGGFGEVFIGGIGVARGYLGDPDLSRQLFVRLPADPAGGLWYRTNDIGRWLPNGELDLCGRRDAQLKIRGNRIEPLEVESRLLEHPAIRQAAVSVHRDHDGHEHLAAHVVFAETERPTIDSLRSYLAETLPPFMVPSLFAVAAALPLTATCKIDRRRLPRLSPESLLRYSSSDTEPMTKSEETIAALWTEVLPFGTTVGRHVSFFDAGGTSLLIVRLHRLVNRTFQRNDSIVELFRYPTVAGYSAFLDRGAATVSPLSPRDLVRIAQRTRQAAT